MNGGAQYSKACEGASLPWVQIPPPPPLTCDDASPLCMLGGGGHRGGLSFGPQMVSVDRAKMPAAGWIGPEFRPRTAGDVIWEETRWVPVGAGRGPRPSRRTRQAGGRLPRLRPDRRAHAHAAEACALPSRAGGTVRDRPDTRQLAECIALSDRVVLDNAPAPRYACRLRCRGGPSCCAERGVLLLVPSPAARAGRLGFWLPGGRAVVM